MDSLSKISSSSPFDSIKRIDEQGNEYWTARELMPMIGYKRWDRVPDVINRAAISCGNVGNVVTDHFSEEARKTLGRTQQDYKLSRLACYLTAMNGDPRKPEVAAAQNYFADKAHQAETVIPAQAEKMRELEMQLDLARTQERLATTQCKLLATVQYLEAVAPGLAPLALGRTDAVVVQKEYIQSVITDQGKFEGVGITYIQKRLGFKSTKSAWDWLDSIGYGKDSGKWESQPAKVYTPRLTPDHLDAVIEKFTKKEGDRQRILFE